MHHHLTLDLIMKPYIAEFQDCNRCGRALPPAAIPTLHRLCADCRTIDSVPGDGMQKKCLPINAAFEVTLHYKIKWRLSCPSYRDLCALRLPSGRVILAEDGPAAWYIARELGCLDDVVVLVTSHGRYVTHWEGYQPHLLAYLPVMRQKYIKTDFQEEIAA